MRKIILNFLLLGFCLMQSALVVDDTDRSGIGKTDECLLSYQSKLDQLLPLSIITKHYKEGLANAKLKYSPSKNGNYDRDKYAYYWPSDRKIPGTPYPESNVIGIQWVMVIDFYSEKVPPLTTFKRLYRNPTEAEKEKGFKEAEKELSKKGVPQNDVKTTVGIGKSLASKTKYLDVPAIGDAAVWEYSSSYLIVLSGKVTFRILANTTGDANINIELAKKLALEVLAKCK